MSAATYDQWKLRADVDELDQPELEQRDECGICGGIGGSHDGGCPDRPSNGDWVDREIDRLKEEMP